jgi:hypothetical protein
MTATEVSEFPALQEAAKFWMPSMATGSDR